jgi:AAA domain
MTITDLDFYVSRRWLCGEPVNGELQAISGRFRRLFVSQADLPVEACQGAWESFLCGFSESERAKIIKGVAAVDPMGPSPQVDALVRPATLADIRMHMADTPWLWNGYIPSARIAGIAACEGVGKTRFAMDLARRLWFGSPWPDGQPATFPAGTKTLWVCADGQQEDLVAIAREFGMPDEAIVFNTPHDEPFGGTEVDAHDDLVRLEGFIGQVRPGLVFIDTLTNATSRDVCRATENKDVMTPLRDIAQRTQTPIIPLLHLSKEGQALGRRIKGITRTIIQLECPDPEKPARLRLWVEKSFAVKPPALGVTMVDEKNDYDHNPPRAAEPGKAGRPPKALEAAEQFIRDALAVENDQIGNNLAAKSEKTGGSSKTFWRAVDAMVEAGELAKDGGTGTGRQVVLHLIDATPDPDSRRPFDAGTESQNPRDLGFCPGVGQNPKIDSGILSGSGSTAKREETKTASPHVRDRDTCEPAGATPASEPVKIAPTPPVVDPAAPSFMVPGRPGKVRTKLFGPQRGDV